MINYIRRLNYRIHLNISLGKGTLARAAREVDATVPASWEFSAFSQNGEDGIIEFLLSQIPDPARTFLEIGSADGLENNSTYLLLVRKFSGTAVEADPRRSDRAQSFLTSFNGGARFINTRVTVEDLDQLVGNLPASPPDVLSLDIDSIDYWIAARLLEIGVRPALWVVEYNSVFGPDAAVTVPADFGAAGSQHRNHDLYFGASIAAFRHLLEEAGYVFVTVETRGVNGVFVDPARFDASFLGSLRGLTFADNFAQVARYGDTWATRQRAITDLPLVTL